MKTITTKGNHEVGLSTPAQKRYGGRAEEGASGNNEWCRGKGIPAVYWKFMCFQHMAVSVLTTQGHTRAGHLNSGKGGGEVSL